MSTQTSSDVRVYINSADRSSGTVSNFSITLPSTLANISAVEIRNVNVPYSFYAITSSNNTYTFLDTGDVSRSVTITAGNYSANALATEFQTQLNASPMTGFTVSYSSTTYKLTVSNAAAFTMLNTGSASSVLGFTGTYAKGTSATADDVIDISGPLSILIKSDALTNPREFKTIISTSSDNTITVVPVKVSPGGFISLDANFMDKVIYPITRISLSSIDFVLENDAGTELDLNGLEWSLELIFNRD